jgi:hypothetical protein
MLIVLTAVLNDICPRVPCALNSDVLFRYGQFLTLLEEGSRDNLDFLKDRCIKCLASLLRAKPEGEARLLAALVNKLGDPSRKLASKVGRT